MKKKYIVYSLIIIFTFIQTYLLIKYQSNTSVKEISTKEIDSISNNKNVKNIDLITIEE